MTAEHVLSPVTKSTTRTDLVADAIRTAILSGRLAQGETLVERRLAERLGVSKTPVREALIGLAATGLVVIGPNRGVTVRVVGRADLRKAYEVRLLLEPWAIGRTAVSGHATDGARAALAEARALLAGADTAALSLANRRFHHELYARCGNELVVAQLDTLQDLAALGSVTVLWRDRPTWPDEHGEHEAILAAVEAGDAALAERLTRRHIERSVARLT
ncbi:GntR family transcriptional regulator [Microbispora sp. NPDC046933]|uniref:GntR family transcriptional regulator n=1 Tax=Microbispora sp. NPDC046933 TaxID=3155618 RepID=UPI0033FC1C45